MYKNAEGYRDPTAGQATEHVWHTYRRDEARIINLMLMMADAAGYRVTSRIEVERKRR